MSNPATYQILLNDETGLQLAELSIFSRMEITQSFNDVGRLILEIPYNANAELVTYGTCPVITRFKDGRKTKIFSGCCGKWYRTYNDRTNNFVLTCSDENSVLANNLALPVPGGPPYSSAEFDARTGVASTVMYDYVKYNIGTSARADRQRVTQAADYGYGVTISEQARWETLLDVLKRCALSGGGLGFRVQDGIFSVYYPETKPVLISEGMGNLLSYEYGVEAARSNYIYLGGSGTGASRTFYETSDSLSIRRYGRKESFVNRSDVSSAAIAASASMEELYNNADKTSFLANIAETESTRFWADFSLGDRVTVEADGLRVTDIVQQIKIAYSGQNGEKLSAVIGNSDGTKHDPILASLDANSRLSARLRRLENK